MPIQRVSAMVPCTLALLDKGEFLRAAERMWEELQGDLLAHLQEHRARAAGATAELTIKVKAKIENTEDYAVSLKTTMTKTTPAPPARVTSAIGSTNQTGQMVFLVRSEGSDYDSPRQGTFGLAEESAPDAATE